MFSLKDKVAVVTGSRRGIGKGIAETLAKAGAKIVITDIDQNDCEKTAQQIARRYKTNAIGLKCDVSDKEDVEMMFSEAAKAFRKIDILVNNAGIFFQKPLDKTQEDDWVKLIDINLKGTFLCSQAALKYLKKTKGKIVNISSIAGIIGYQQASAYCASKGGIITMTREMAIELAKHSINVNAIAPGAIDTPMTDFMKKDKKLYLQTMAAIPLNRMGKPEEIGAAALYLSSDEAGYVTGHTLVVDGGWVSQ